MRTRIPFALLATALACSFFADPALALRARVFVSAAGTDSGACSFDAACRTLNYAFGQVEAGGEITMLDSAGYDPLNITKSITITSPAGVEAGIAAAANGYAISIVAPGADVTLRGLTLDGGGMAYNGIVFTAGASLTVIDCVVRNFVYDGADDPTTGNGILMEPFSGTFSFVITNTIALNNSNAGIVYSPSADSTTTANGVIDHVVATNNSYGITINTHLGGGSTTAAISNSIASNNSDQGIDVDNGSNPLTVSIDNTGVSGNHDGILANDTVKVLLGRSAITDNSNVGTLNETTSNSFYTYGDNRINGNLTDGYTTLNTSFTTH